MAILALLVAGGAQRGRTRRRAVSWRRWRAATRRRRGAPAPGADPDAADRSGWTGLHQAADKGDLSLARAFLEAGAHPDLRSRARGTPLDVAERSGRLELAGLLRQHGARGSGKSIGDTVCVRPWRGDGYCGVVEAADPTRYRLRVSRVVGCAAGCEPEPSCSGGRGGGRRAASARATSLWVPASCLTHTGVR